MWRVWWAFYTTSYRRQVKPFVRTEKFCISITSSCICVGDFQLFLSFLPFQFQFAWCFRLFWAFELEKFYKHLQLRNRLDNSAEKITWLLLGVVNNNSCCIFLFFMGRKINNCCSCRLLGRILAKFEFWFGGKSIWHGPIDTSIQLHHVRVFTRIY